MYRNRCKFRHWLCSLPVLDGIRHQPAEPTPIPPSDEKMLFTVILLQIAIIIFGINNLLPFVPDMALLGILFIIGILQINMARILQNRFNT